MEATAIKKTYGAGPYRPVIRPQRNPHKTFAKPFKWQDTPPPLPGNHLAGHILYSNTQRLKESESTYQEVLNIRRELAKSNPATHQPDVATTLMGLGIVYFATDRRKRDRSVLRGSTDLPRASEGRPNHFSAKSRCSNKDSRRNSRRSCSSRQSRMPLTSLTACT